jgi:hypothetical protein
MKVSSAAGSSACRPGVTISARGLVWLSGRCLLRCCQQSKCKNEREGRRVTHHLDVRFFICLIVYIYSFSIRHMLHSTTQYLWGLLQAAGLRGCWILEVLLVVVVLAMRDHDRLQSRPEDSERSQRQLLPSGHPAARGTEASYRLEWSSPKAKYHH